MSLFELPRDVLSLVLEHCIAEQGLGALRLRQVNQSCRAALAQTRLWKLFVIRQHQMLVEACWECLDASTTQIVARRALNAVPIAEVVEHMFEAMGLMGTIQSFCCVIKGGSLQRLTGIPDMVIKKRTWVGGACDLLSTKSSMYLRRGLYAKERFEFETMWSSCSFKCFQHPASFAFEENCVVKTMQESDMGHVVKYYDFFDNGRTKPFCLRYPNCKLSMDQPICSVEIDGHLYSEAISVKSCHYAWILNDERIFLTDTNTFVHVDRVTDGRDPFGGSVIAVRLEGGRTLDLNYGENVTSYDQVVHWTRGCGKDLLETLVSLLAMLEKNRGIA